MLLGAAIRLFFNLRHAGRTYWWIPAAVVVAGVALAIAIKPDDESGAAPTGNVAAGRATFAKAGCANCHTLADAGATGQVGPNLDAARPSASLVVERVTNGMGAMPSFRGDLSETNIADVAAYVAAVAAK
jgi:mono/diheme cytochrome c family protein